MTVGGTIRGLGDERALAGDLIFYGIPKALTWNLKDVATHDFEDMSDLQVGERPRKKLKATAGLKAEPPMDRTLERI